MSALAPEARMDQILVCPRTGSPVPSAPSAPTVEGAYVKGMSRAKRRKVLGFLSIGWPRGERKRAQALK
jgi:hypothetical protein